MVINTVVRFQPRIEDIMLYDRKWKTAQINVDVDLNCCNFTLENFVSKGWSIISFGLETILWQPPKSVISQGWHVVLHEVKDGTHFRLICYIKFLWVCFASEWERERERGLVNGQNWRVGVQCMSEMTEQRANSKSCMFFVVAVVFINFTFRFFFRCYYCRCCCFILHATFLLYKYISVWSILLREIYWTAPNQNYVPYVWIDPSVKVLIQLPRQLRWVF